MYIIRPEPDKHATPNSEWLIIRLLDYYLKSGKVAPLSFSQVADVCRWSRNKASKLTKDLTSLGVLDVTFLSDQEAKDLIVETSGTGGLGDKVCSWCGCRTYILHRHHFPKRRKDGGQETVDICPNCHANFHFLTDTMLYVLSKKVLKESGLLREDGSRKTFLEL